MANSFAANTPLGNEGNSGLTSLLPKLLAASAVAIATTAGDTCALRGGDLFQELITVPASGTVGNRITYTSFGVGQATLQGADVVTGWVFDSAQAGGDRWKKVTLGFGLAPIYLWAVDSTNTAALRIRDASIAACTTDGHWVYDTPSDTIYAVGPAGWAGPETGGNTWHAGRRTNCLKGSVTKDYIAVVNLHMRFHNTTLATEALIQYSSTTLTGNGWLVAGNWLEWGPCGIFIKANTNNGYAAAYDITVTNNNVQFMLAHGISISNYTAALVQGNIVNGCGRQGMGDFIKNSTVTLNTLSNNANALGKYGAQALSVSAFDAGMYLVGTPSPLVSSSGNVASFNVVFGNAKAGMATDAANDNNIFHHNVVYNNTQFGIFFEGGTENGSFGNAAYNNTSYGNGKSGLHINNAQGNFTALNNLLYFNGRDGSQDLWVQHDYSGTWTLHSGTPGVDAVYKRLNARWAPATVAFALGTVATARGSIALVQANANSWFHDPAGTGTLYGRNTGSTAFTSAFCTHPTPDVINFNGYTPAASLAGGAKIARFNAPTGATNYTDLATMRAAESIEANGVQVDPRYASVGSGNFNLAVDSPVIDIGTIIAGINDGTVFGCTRFVGAGPDLGALELGLPGSGGAAGFGPSGGLGNLSTLT